MTLTPIQEIIQEKHHQQLFSALIPTLEAPEHRFVTCLPYITFL